MLPYRDVRQLIWMTRTTLPTEMVGSVSFTQKTGMAFPSIPESVHPPFLKNQKIIGSDFYIDIGNLVVFPQPHFFIHNHLTY